MRKIIENRMPEHAKPPTPLPSWDKWIYYHAGGGYIGNAPFPPETPETASVDCPSRRH